MANFSREPAYLGIVQPLGQFQTLIAPIGRNIRGLAREVDVVFRVDLNLLCDFRWQIAKLGPDRREFCRPDVGVRQQLEGAAPLAILVEHKPIAIRLAGSQRNRASKVASRSEGGHFRLMAAPAPCAHAANRNASSGQTLVGIVSA